MSINCVVMEVLSIVQVDNFFFKTVLYMQDE